MPLVKEDLLQIEKLVEELLLKKEVSRAPYDKEAQRIPSSSDREIFERILNVELELKYQRDLIEKVLHQMDKRFEELREDMNRRFEQVDKRFEELREDMNKRFSQLFWFIGLFIPLSNSLLFLALSYVLK